MSLNIKKAVAKPIQGLLDLMEEAQAFSTGIPPKGDDPEIFYRNRILCVDILLDRMQIKLDFLKQKNAEWESMVKNPTLKKDLLEKELTEYSTMLDDEKGLANVINLAEDAICILKGYKVEASNLMKPFMSKVTTTPEYTQVKPKLPQLELGTFAGDILEWISFRDTFVSLIHSQNLAPVNKLIYLKKALRGDALKLIEGLPLTDQAYQVAWELLNNRYGDLKILRSKLYELLSSKAFYKKDIATFQRSFENLIRSFEIIGEDINQSSLLCIVENNLPVSIMRLILRDKSYEKLTWDIHKLRIFLDKQVKEQEILSRIGENTEESWKANKNMIRRPNKFINKDRYTSAITASTPQNDKRLPRCAFCEESHWIDKCTKFQDVNERRELLTKNRCCLKCLKPGHIAKECKKQISCYYCKRQHNSAICNYKIVSTKSNKKEMDNHYAWKPFTQEAVNICTKNVPKIACCERSLLLCRGIKAVNPYYPEISEALVIFFDSGAQYSYILTSAYKKMKLPNISFGKTEIVGFGQHVQENDTVLTSLTVKTVLGRDIKIYARTVEKLVAPMYYVPSDVKIEPRCQDLVWGQPDLLIGADYYFKFIKETPIKSKHNDHYQIESLIGPMLAGNHNDNIDNVKLSFSNYPSLVCSNLNYAYTEDIETSENSVERMWSLESIGISDLAKGNNDEEAYRQFRESLSIQNDRYFISWPWKFINPNISRNYGIAYGRLKSIWNKYRKNTEIWEKYDGVIKAQLKDGVIERAPPESDLPVYYIPHLPVIKDDKVRIVYDASSAPTKGTSLNENLYRGPINTPLIANILLRLRDKEVILMADIEKAFLQIGLHSDQRDVTRFLWLKDCWLPPMDGNIRTYRFTRVPFGIKSSPFLLSGVIRYHLEKTDTMLAEQLLKNLYVDNVFFLAYNAKEAIHVYNQSRKIFDKANMNLRMFISNHSLVNHRIDPEHRHPLLTQPRTNNILKVLGIDYDFVKDEFLIQVDKPANIPDTKRKLLQNIASIFDPLGWISPILIEVKYLMQRIWEKQTSWDEEIPKPELQQLSNIYNKWSPTTFRIHRYLKAYDIVGDTELHCFVDASKYAYAAAVYLIQRSKVCTLSSLMMSKIRVSNPKLTIPKMELMAATIGSKLLNYLISVLEYKIDKLFLWSDSMITLAWIKSNSDKLPVFVRNRVNEINRNKNIQFLYVPTEQNVADIATRPVTPSALQANYRWYFGPKWLRTLNWPKQPDEATLLGRQLPINAVVTPSSKPTCKIIDFKYKISLPNCSTWNKLVRTVLYVLKFIVYSSKKDKIFSENLDPYLIKLMIFSSVQAETISKEIIEKWNLYPYHNRVYVFTGRITSQDPLLWLPSEHRVTELIIMSIHQDLGHSGVPHVLSHMRRTIWIPKGRATVKKVISRNCMVCRKWQAKPFRLPLMPPLPEHRTNLSRPFEFVGIDLFGPIMVAQGDRACKRWVTLTTCLVTRAINLQLTIDMSSHYLLLAMRRFIAQWGIPNRILSDNGTNFRLIARILENVKVPVDQIKWKFITQHSPWQGGIYERLIGITKNSLKKVLGKGLLNEEELRTVLSETEYIVNTRPLCYVPSESIDIIRPLDLVYSKANHKNHLIMPEPLDDTEGSMTKSSLLDYWERASNLTERFWNLWSQDYLNTLRERSTQQHRNPKSVTFREPQINEIVLLKSPNAPRATWKLAKIADLDPSNSCSRKALLILSNGKTLTRPICFLYPLEISDSFLNVKNCITQSPSSFASATEETDTDTAAPNDNSNEDTIELRSRKIRKRTSPSSVNYIQLNWPFFIMLVAILNQFTLLLASNSAYLCSRYSPGHWYKIPSPLNCTFNYDHQVDIKHAMIYSETFSTIPSFTCTKMKREVCTQAIFRLILRVVKDQATISNVALPKCKQLQKTKRHDNQLLEKVDSSTWISKIPTKYSYGWLGTTCHTTINYKITEGVVKFMGNVSNSKGCHMSHGYCMSAHETVIWDSKHFNSTCGYKSMGNYPVYVSKSYVSVPQLQATFIKSDDQSPTPRSCGFINPVRMAGLFILDITEKNAGTNDDRSTHDEQILRIFSEKRLNNSDPYNPKLQFLYNQLQKLVNNHTKELAHKMCLDYNAQLRIIKWISYRDPTEAAKIWMSTQGIRAESYGDILLVKPCQKIIPNYIAHNHKFKGICYEDKPALIGMKLAFIQTKTSEIVWKSRKIKCNTLLNRTTPSSFLSKLHLEKNLINFKGNQLNNIDLQKIFLTLQHINGNEYALPVNESGDEIPEINLIDEGESLVTEFGHQVDITTQNISQEIGKVVSYWRIFSLPVIILFVLITLIIFNWYVSPIVMFCSSFFRRSRSASTKRTTSFITFKPTLAGGNVGNFPEEIENESKI